jgi:fatty acid desaturase
MRTLNAISDPVYQAKSLNAVEQFFLRFIRDPRDLPFIFLCLQIIFIVIPLAVALFFVDGTAWWAVAAAFLGFQLYFLGPFTLMLHNTSHNPFFKREYKWGNRLIPWGLCPVMGQSPDTYFSHHIGMHHAENNLHLDKSSTMAYRRDSFFDFLKYYFRFLFVGIFELFSYLRFRNKTSFLRKAAIGEITFIAFCLVLLWFDWQSTLLVFVGPLIFVRFMMMSGNWAQHAFVDPDAPANNYQNSITCINTAYNRRCFNDGYHIGHHLKPHLHWTEMPKDFLANVEKYAANRALVFEGADYHQIWAMLMFKRYDALANYLVNLNGMYRDKSEAVALLKRRTQKIDV